MNLQTTIKDIETKKYKFDVCDPFDDGQDFMLELSQKFTILGITNSYNTYEVLVKAKELELSNFLIESGYIDNEEDFKDQITEIA